MNNLEKEIELLKEIIRLKERIMELEGQQYNKWVNPYPQYPTYPTYPTNPYPMNPYPFTTWVSTGGVPLT